MHIAICIATFKRPKLLKQLLEGLSGMSFERMDEPVIQIVVADNDGSGGAEEVCRVNMSRWPLTYRIEPRRGIAQARNCALREASQADFVAFIDDDEIPDPQWLEELLLAQAKYLADVVSGPVRPSFTSDVPGWVKRGRFFDSPDYTTGQVLNWCATNNALVARAVFAKVQCFDEQFQLSGADDLHFFSRVHRAGLKIVWTVQAVVSESIAIDRANFGWLLRRSYRGGNCFVLVESALDRKFATRIMRFVKACMRIVQGSFEMLGVAFQGQVQLVRAMRRISLGVGMLAGLADVKYQPYRTVTGE